MRSPLRTHASPARPTRPIQSLRPTRPSRLLLPTCPIGSLHPTRSLRPALLPALGLAVALGLTACSTTTDPAPASSETITADVEPAGLVVSDAWVKAADSGMTAAFGTLTNASDADIRVVSATSPASSTMEIHEMATGDDGAMVMRPKEGGVVVPAGGTAELAPGGDHLMLMDITEPILPGDEVTVVLTTEDGSTVEISAQARTFDGGNETYEGGDGGTEGMAGMDPTPSGS